MSALTVDTDTLIVETDLSEVHKIPFNDRKFRVISKLFGTEHTCKAYASEMQVLPSGFIEMAITIPHSSGRRPGRPFHYWTGDILFAMKPNKHRLSDSFALNHELFALPEWQTSILLHFMNGTPYIFSISREEWMANGKPGHQNEELQVFIEIPDYRRLTVSSSDGGAIPYGGRNWLEECIAFERQRCG